MSYIGLIPYSLHNKTICYLNVVHNSLWGYTVCGILSISKFVENISQFKTGNEVNDNDDNNTNKTATTTLIIITLTRQKTVTISTNQNTGPILKQGLLC